MHDSKLKLAIFFVPFISQALTYATVLLRHTIILATISFKNLPQQTDTTMTLGIEVVIIGVGMSRSPWLQNLQLLLYDDFAPAVRWLLFTALARANAAFCKCKSEQLVRFSLSASPCPTCSTLPGSIINVIEDYPDCRVKRLQRKSVLFLRCNAPKGADCTR